MTVFVVTRSSSDGFDYSEAKKFGDVKFVFDEDAEREDRRPISKLVEHCKDLFRATFDEAPTDDHYLIINRGPLLYNALARGCLDDRLIAISIPALSGGRC